MGLVVQSLRGGRVTEKTQYLGGVANGVKECFSVSVYVPKNVILSCLQGFLGEKEDFLLFASLFEITMMDPSVGTKPVRFELSIGEFYSHRMSYKHGLLLNHRS